MGILFLILSIIIFSIIKILEYYFISWLWFFAGFFWIGGIILLIIFIVLQIIKIIKFRKNIKIIYIINVAVFLLFLYLHINIKIINRIIEKSDWKILYTARAKIIEKVINNELNPNVEWNNIVCQLPFEFPIVSNGGNDILIYRYSDNTVTVQFYIYRGFFEHPVTAFVYTNNKVVVDKINQYIINNTENNWKINENWFRLFGMDINDNYYFE